MSMFVLSRQINESIVVSDDVTITVAAIHGDKVRLAIEAPHAVPVHRKEVYDAIQDAARRHMDAVAPADLLPQPGSAAANTDAASTNEASAKEGVLK